MSVTLKIFVKTFILPYQISSIKQHKEEKTQQLSSLIYNFIQWDFFFIEGYQFSFGKVWDFAKKRIGLWDERKKSDYKLGLRVGLRNFSWLNPGFWLAKSKGPKRNKYGLKMTSHVTCKWPHQVKIKSNTCSPCGSYQFTKSRHFSF